MNFMITRAELIALTGICRTETFALQKAGKLQRLAGTNSKSWFDLSQALRCIAEVRNVPLPSESSVQMFAQIACELRSKRLAERKQKRSSF